MAVTIRLQRCGKKNRPYYHIVVKDKRAKRDGGYIEKLGYYDPLVNPSKISLKEDRLKFWYGLGATLSNTVQTIIKKQKIDLNRLKTSIRSNEQS